MTDQLKLIDTCTYRAALWPLQVLYITEDEWLWNRIQRFHKAGLLYTSEIAEIDQVYRGIQHCRQELARKNRRKSFHLRYSQLEDHYYLLEDLVKKAFIGLKKNGN